MKIKITFVVTLLSMFLVIEQIAALTFNVTVPNGTKQCWLVGNFKLIQGTTDWDAAYYKLNKVDDTHFTIDVPNADITSAGLDQTTIAYKYLSGPRNWSYAEKSLSGTDVDLRSYTTSDVVANWGTVYNPQLFTIKISTPKTVSECYITGFFNAWLNPANGIQMTLDTKNSDSSKNLFYAKINSTPDSMAYKFAAGPGWAYLQNNPSSDFKDTDSVPHTGVSFNRVLNYATTKTVVFNVKVPAGTNQIYLMGSNAKWDGVNWICGVKNPNGTFTLTVNNVDLMDYSYFNSTDWGFNEINPDGNQRFRSVDAQLGTSFNDEITAWKKNIYTGLTDFENSNSFVHVIEGAIVVENVKDNVSIVDIKGIKIENKDLRGKYISPKLKTGLYIVCVDNKTEKVFLK